MWKSPIKLVAESLNLWLASRVLIVVAEMVDHEKKCTEYTAQNVEHGMLDTQVGARRMGTFTYHVTK